MGTHSGTLISKLEKKLWDIDIEYFTVSLINHIACSKCGCSDTCVTVSRDICILSTDINVKIKGRAPMLREC